MSIVIAILAIAVGLSFIIFIHELGHFIFAKRAGVRVEVFSIGFGPRLIGMKKGDTEYRISMVPLGGYVKLSGEQLEPGQQPAAYDMQAASAKNKFLIFMAGSLMNFLIGFPIAIAAMMIGMYVPSNTVGRVGPDKQEWEAGMRMGDKIVMLDGEPISNLEEYKMSVIRKSTGTTMKVVVIRDGKELPMDVIAGGSKKVLAFSDFGAFVSKTTPESPAAKAGLREGDEIVKVNGRPIFTATRVQEIIYEKPDETVTLTVKRTVDGVSSETDLSFKLNKLFKNGKVESYYSIEYSDLVPPVIAAVAPNGPAGKGGIKPGDLVLSIDGEPIGSWGLFTRKVRACNGKELAVVVKRGDGEVSLKVTPYVNQDGVGQVDIVPDIMRAGVYDEGYKLFGMTLRSPAPVPPTDFLGEPPVDSILYKAGFRFGDKIKAQTIETVVRSSSKTEDISNVGDIQWVFTEPAKVFFTVIRGGKEISIPVELEEKFTYEPFAELTAKREFFAYTNIFKAAYYGAYTTLDMSLLTYQLLVKLAKGDESANDLSGPIGIVYMSYLTVIREGAGRFLWLLMLISVNLAVVNMLPIPILDGGQIMFLLIEKVKGSPLSEKGMAVAQYIGLGMILLLFAFVMYRDIYRMLTQWI